jgi:hypothetical protein
MAAHTMTLKEARVREHDAAELVRTVTEHDSYAKKKATDGVKAQTRKQYELFRRTQPSDEVAVACFPLGQSMPRAVPWVD